MNFTGKDMLQQGEIIRTCSRTRESFVERLANESEPHMIEMAKAMYDSHLDFSLWDLHKLVHAAHGFIIS
jgi:hypothetical protein